MADLNISGLLKKGDPSYEPHDLTIVTDPRRPLYEERVEDPITDERIMNFAVCGQLQPVVVRADGDELVVVEGRQRVKRALVINHIVGRHAYRGPIRAVHEAIARLKGTDLCKRIVEECPRGMKIKVTLNRGDEKEAARAAAAANFHRDDDPLERRIRSAHRMAKHGFDAKDIAEAMSVSEQTAERWLARDPNAPKTKQTRGKATRPSAKRLAAVYANVHHVSDAKLLLAWVLGKESDAALLTHAPGLAEVLGMKAKKAA